MPIMMHSANLCKLTVKQLALKWSLNDHVSQFSLRGHMELPSLNFFGLQVIF